MSFVNSYQRESITIGKTLHSTCLSRQCMVILIPAMTSLHIFCANASTSMDSHMQIVQPLVMLDRYHHPRPHNQVAVTKLQGSPILQILLRPEKGKRIFVIFGT